MTDTADVRSSPPLLGLSWGSITYGAVLSGGLGAVLLALLFRERRASVLGAAAAATLLGPLTWNAILRHTGGEFFVDAPIAVFPVSLQDTGSGIFATAAAALTLGFGPLGSATGRRLAVGALLCGAAALLVDIYLY